MTEDEKKLKEDEEFELEIVDDEEEEGKAASASTHESPDDTDDGEDEDISPRAQKRIAQLANRVRELEQARAANQWESGRQQQESRPSQEQSKEEPITEAELLRMEMHQGKLESQLNTLESQWAKADEDGDRTEARRLQRQMVETEAKLIQVKNYLSWADGEKRKQKPVEQSSSQPTQSQPNQQPEIPVEAKRAFNKWRQNNTWFGTDKVKTAAAAAIDSDLRAEGYLDPSMGLDDPDFGLEAYYMEVDKRMSKAFGGNDGGRAPAKRQSPPPVSGKSRAPSNGKTRVKITREEVDMANRLGITPEQYAIEAAKIRRDRGEA